MEILNREIENLQEEIKVLGNRANIGMATQDIMIRLYIIQDEIKLLKRIQQDMGKEIDVNEENK